VIKIVPHEIVRRDSKKFGVIKKLGINQKTKRDEAGRVKRVNRADTSPQYGVLHHLASEKFTNSDKKV
jgi:hypothetical protein